MSTISAGTTVGTALVNTGDTTGNLVIKTGANATTALTISGTDQSITVAGGLNLGAPVAVASGGTGANTAANARTNLGLVIGTDVLAPNGSGANVTSLNASNISSGTLAVARGGTGVTSTGTSGNVLTSNGTAWVSQALPAGGVTSLNGQTGSVTTTSVDAIGSVIVAVVGNSTGGVSTTTTFSANATIAGSSLRYNYSRGVAGEGGIAQIFYKAPVGDGSYTGGGTALSGTWRFLSYAQIFRSDSCANYGIWYPALLVRIS